MGCRRQGAVQLHRLGLAKPGAGRIRTFDSAGKAVSPFAESGIIQPVVECHLKRHLPDENIIIFGSCDVIKLIVFQHFVQRIHLNAHIVKPAGLDILGDRCGHLESFSAADGKPARFRELKECCRILGRSLPAGRHKNSDGVILSFDRTKPLVEDIETNLQLAFLAWKRLDNEGAKDCLLALLCRRVKIGMIRRTTRKDRQFAIAD